MEQEGSFEDVPVKDAQDTAPLTIVKRTMRLGYWFLGGAVVLPAPLLIVVTLGAAVICDVFRLGTHRLTPVIYAIGAAIGLHIALLILAACALARGLFGANPPKGRVRTMGVLALVVAISMLPFAVWAFFFITLHMEGM